MLAVVDHQREVEMETVVILIGGRGVLTGEERVAIGSRIDR